MSNTLNITLKIDNTPFQMEIQREDEYAYRQAEKLINERRRHYADTFPKQSNETYLIMTLLDIALKYKQNELRNDTQPFEQALSDMLRDINAQLP